MSKQKGGSLVDKGREKKRRKKEGKQTGGGKKRNLIERERERNGREKQKGGFSRHSDGRSSTVQEENLIHASRATRGYQNFGVLSNFKR